MIIRCKTCKKETDILCPELWVYKKFIGHGLAWFCSWGCLRAYERETKERKEAEKMQKKTECSLHILVASQRFLML